MSSLVERVARAIFEAWAKEEGSDATWEEVVRASGDDDFPNIQKWHRMAFAEARAAIEAMREPSAQMLIDVGTMSGWDAHAQSSADQCHIAWWSDMIDAALSEPSE